MKTMVLLAALAAIGLVPGAAAHEGNVHMTFEGRENGCPSGKSMCFTVTNGSMADMRPGAQVEVRFQNMGTTQHMWMVTTMDNMDAMHKGTGHMMSMGAIENVPPGGSGNATFTVPMDARGLYVWCGEPGHEQLGMWTLQEFETQGAGAGTPVPWFLGVGAVAVAVFILGRRTP